MDSLRAVAIFWVFFYHFFEFWTPSGHGMALLPFGDAARGFPLFDVGHLGVSLFFIISGFVILLTLQRTASIIEFAVRRVARLYPTLILCGTITFFVTSLFGPEQIRVGVSEFLLSILSLPPENVGTILGISDWGWLDGSYWSLWVEIRYYAIFGLIFYMFRTNWLTVWLIFQAACLVLFLSFKFTGLGILDSLGGLLIYQFVPLFSVGMFAYLIYMKADGRSFTRIMLVLSVLHSFLVSMFSSSDPSANTSLILGNLVVFTLFFGALTSKPLQKALSFGPLVKIGQSSYSFYLLHQMIGLSLLHVMSPYIPGYILLFLGIPIILAILIVLS
ncbi:MAG: acyltransferase, partial [Bacteroidota bacterium]